MAHAPSAHFLLQARGLRRATLMAEQAAKPPAPQTADLPLMAMVQQIDDDTDCGVFFPAVVDVGIGLYLPI